MTLKSFIPGERIKASDTNSNNDYLLEQIEDNAETLDHKIEAIKSTITSQIVSMVSNLYPVGSIFIGTTVNCPLSSIVGTWQLVGAGRVLQGADGNHAAGTTIAAGLPNITGSIASSTGQMYSATGAFNISGTVYGQLHGGFNGNLDKAYFDASRSSSIYGKSTTVQPPAYVVNIWRRVS